MDSTERALKHLALDVKRLRRSRKDTILCLDIQERLIAAIRRLERRSRIATAQRKRFRIERNQAGLPAAQREVIKQEIDVLSEKIDDCRRFMTDYRMIGDAIAHIYIDRHDIKPTAFKESPGFLTGKSGLRLELRSLRYALRRGLIAILNDLTNCLRYGDLTLVLKGGVLRFVEIKDRRVPETKYPRDERQLQNLRDMAGYVLADEPISLYGYVDQKFHRKALGSHPVRLTSEINRVIRKAYTAGVVCKEIENGLFYVVFTSLVEDSGDVIRVIERDGPPVGDAMLLRLSEVREWWPSYSPLMFSIRSPEHWLDIVFGRTSVWVLITVTKLKEAFARSNVKAEVLPSEGTWALALTHGPDCEADESKIGAHLMYRIATEFVSLKWFVEEFAMLPSLPDSPDGREATSLPTNGQ